MTDEQANNIALFDMDGTLCDYNGQLLADLRRVTPEDMEGVGEVWQAPSKVRPIAEMIKSRSEWWAGIPRLQLGWDVLAVTQELNYRTMILTQGPRNSPEAWTGKKLWIDRNLGPETDMTITRDKGLVYGKVLVDDWPDYAENWLAWRKNGLVVMPANEANRNYSHPQVIRYDGTNLAEVRLALEARKRSAEDLHAVLRDISSARTRVR